MGASRYKVDTSSDAATSEKVQTGSTNFFGVCDLQVQHSCRDMPCERSSAPKPRGNTGALKGNGGRLLQPPPSSRLQSACIGASVFAV
jgi:hypothetical protein